MPAKIPLFAKIEKELVNQIEEFWIFIGFQFSALKRLKRWSRFCFRCCDLDSNYPLIIKLLKLGRAWIIHRAREERDAVFAVSSVPLFSNLFFLQKVGVKSG